MSQTRRAVLALSLLLAAPAVAHHGWAGYLQVDFELDGTVQSAYLGNPHGVVKVQDSAGKVWDVVQAAWQHPDRYTPVERAVRPLVRQVVEPLRLGTMAEDRFVLGDEWRAHLEKHREAAGAAAPTRTGGARPRHQPDGPPRVASGACPGVPHVIACSSSSPRGTSRTPSRARSARSVPWCPTPTAPASATSPARRGRSRRTAVTGR